MLKKIILVCMLNLSFCLFTTPLVQGADNVKNQFVSVFDTAAGQRCYRDMATDSDFGTLKAASDAPLEAALGKSLVRGDENNPPSDRYIQWLGLAPIEKVDESGVLINRGHEIVNCDVIYSPAVAAVATFKARTDGPVIPGKLQELIITSDAPVTLTGGYPYGGD